MTIIADGTERAEAHAPDREAPSGPALSVRKRDGRTLPFDSTRIRAAITKAFMESPTKAKAAFDKLSDGKDREFKAVDAQYYEPVVELIKFVDALRKQKS